MTLRRAMIALLVALVAIGAMTVTAFSLQPTATPTSSAADNEHEAGAADVPQPASNRVATARNLVEPPVPAPAEPAEPAAAPPTADPAEAEVLALVNTERSAAGCPALAWDEPLAQVARVHSADMAARDFFDHTNPDGLSPFDRAAAAGTTASAENIAAGQQSAAEVMASWMASPGHRANILNCGLTRIGVGVGYGGSYGITWTQLFG